MRRGLIYTDVHRYHVLGDHPSYRLFKKFAKSFQPDFLIELGDLFEFPYVSSHNKQKLRILNEGDYEEDMEFGRKDYEDLLKICDNITVLEGNHDYRLETAIDESPYLKTTYSLANKIGFKDLGIDYIPYYEQPYKFGFWNFIHGYRTGKNAAKSHLMDMGANVVAGHVHNFQYHAHVPLSTDEVIHSHTLGCLSARHALWSRTPLPHQNGFAVMYANSTKSIIKPVHIEDNSLIFEGKEYKL